MPLCDFSSGWPCIVSTAPGESAHTPWSFASKLGKFQNAALTNIDTTHDSGIITAIGMQHRLGEYAQREREIEHVYSTVMDAIDVRDKELATFHEIEAVFPTTVAAMIDYVNGTAHQHLPFC